MREDTDTIEMFDFKLSVETARRLLEWISQPEARVFKDFLASKQEVFDERSELQIGANAIADVLNRERAIAGKLAMKDVLRFFDDLANAIQQYEEDAKLKNK